MTRVLFINVLSTYHF